MVRLPIDINNPSERTVYNLIKINAFISRIAPAVATMK